MKTREIVAAAILALLSSPVVAQEVGGACGPGPQGSEPAYYAYEGAYPTYPDHGFWPGRGAGISWAAPSVRQMLSQLPRCAPWRGMTPMRWHRAQPTANAAIDPTIRRAEPFWGMTVAAIAADDRQKLLP